MQKAYRQIGYSTYTIGNVPSRRNFEGNSGWVMVRTFPVRLLWRIGQAAFRQSDEYARRHGWRIEAGRFGLSRTYRHPGFDQFASCPDCGGSGLLVDVRCDRCSGTGRVTLSEPTPVGWE